MRARLRHLVSGCVIAFVACAGTSLVGACGVKTSALCVTAQDCRIGACVAGRCQSDAGVPYVEAATRWTFAPVDIACVGKDDTTPPPMPPYCVLGRKDSARIFLRFSAPIPEHAEVIEAYVLLTRARRVESDGAVLKLRAARIVGDWNGQTLLAATAPPTEEALTPFTFVNWGEVVRVDVRDIVKQWRRKDPDDRGLVIEAEHSLKVSPHDDGGSPDGTSGTAFAFAPNEDGSERPPSLELYVK